MLLELAGTVNLLPWREAVARRARLRLLQQLGICLAIVIACAAIATWQLKRMVALSTSQTSVLNSEILANAARARDAQTTVNEIARWQGFGALDPVARESQTRIVNFLRDASAQSVPGIAARSMAFNGEVIEVKGMTKSKSLAVDYVRGLKARGWPAASPTVAAGDADFKEFQFLIKPKAKKKK